MSSYISSDIICKKLKVDLKNVSDFISSKQQFTDYLKVHAYKDQIEQMGQTWVFIYESKIIGFITIAMAHMEKRDYEELEIEGHENIPSLLIGHLSTHRDFEGRGVGKHMMSWAINKALEYSESVGCRLVILSPERDVIGFYKKRGFNYISHDDDDDQSDSMFFDVK